METNLPKNNTETNILIRKIYDSGGHLNPAVSVAGAIMKKFKWQKVPYYMLAQYLGAFIAACGTYAVYAGKYLNFP